MAWRAKLGHFRAYITRGSQSPLHAKNLNFPEYLEPGKKHEVACAPRAGGLLRVHSQVSMETVRIVIFLSWIFLFIWLFFHSSGLDGNEYFPDSLEIQPLLTDKYLDLGTSDPKCLGVDLLGCTTLGVQSWLTENATPYNCSVHSLCRCSCGPVEWHFCTFYSTCPLCSLSTSVCICLCLHLCITIIYLSISLEVSVSVLLSVLFSFNF